MDSPPPATEPSTASTGQSASQDEAEIETVDSDSTTTPTSAPDESTTQPTADGPTDHNKGAPFSSILY